MPASACALVLTTCLGLVHSFEGLRLVPYLDRGAYAVGYGHDLLKGEHRGPITGAKADWYAARDIAQANASVKRLTLGLHLRPNEGEALCDFVFNLGTASLEKSTLLKKLRVGDRARAANEFLRWDHATGPVLKGLLRRRQAERALFLATGCP